MENEEIPFDDDFISAMDVAAMLGMKEISFRNKLSRTKRRGIEIFPLYEGVKGGRRRIYFRRSEVDEYLARGRLRSVAHVEGI